MLMFLFSSKHHCAQAGLRASVASVSCVFFYFLPAFDLALMWTRFCLRVALTLRYLGFLHIVTQFYRSTSRKPTASKSFHIKPFSSTIAYFKGAFHSNFSISSSFFRINKKKSFSLSFYIFFIIFYILKCKYLSVIFGSVRYCKYLTHLNILVSRYLP